MSDRTILYDNGSPYAVFEDHDDALAAADNLGSQAGTTILPYYESGSRPEFSPHFVTRIVIQDGEAWVDDELLEPSSLIDDDDDDVTHEVLQDSEDGKIVLQSGEIVLVNFRGTDIRFVQKQAGDFVYQFNQDNDFADELIGVKIEFVDPDDEDA